MCPILLQRVLFFWFIFGLRPFLFGCIRSGYRPKVNILFIQVQYANVVVVTSKWILKKNSASVFISRDPLYLSPPGPQRPHAGATKASHITTPCPRRYNDRLAGGMREKPLLATRRSLPGKAEKVEIPPSSWRTRCTAVMRTAELLCCRCGLVGTHCSTAVALLWWIGRWVGGAWCGCLVGGGSLAIHEVAGGRTTTNLHAFLTGLRILNIPEPTKTVYCRTYCCTAVLLYRCCGLVSGWLLDGGCSGWCMAA